ncbi:putative hydroxypyruvate isomerase isoform X1 [Ictalurus furcatus]|uniref:putative hydroxypyruvate isomerase isoform X1 n=1 Tax=Ictalurus furcatus TaxID=66913 RepID=UPI002350D7B3|nr:putative hydroxypyruvate isomerase isoform X1 [Ictalurus furcatus]XP_053491884.1 putative hydroxypyruvate isomerase isoform X1 [Ictalurus furcatus]
MTSLKFCANISWLFTELPELSERLRAAACAGFQAVEAAWLYGSDLRELQKVREESGLQVALINTPPGDVKNGELGLGAVPGREQDFRQGLAQAVQYAKALDCKRIHVMAGRVPAGAQLSEVGVEMETTFVQNLKHAADILSKEGIMGLIEPINTRITDPQYFLDSPHQAAAILQKVDHPNMKLQMDIFHWQIMDGNLTQNIRRYFPLIGHIQVAQVPDRHEPDSPGEINFPYIFKLLEELGYQGYVGCEYKPLGSTENGLGWLKKYQESKHGQSHV